MLGCPLQTSQNSQTGGRSALLHFVYFFNQLSSHFASQCLRLLFLFFIRLPSLGLLSVSLFDSDELRRNGKRNSPASFLLLFDVVGCCLFFSPLSLFLLLLVLNRRRR